MTLKDVLLKPIKLIGGGILDLKGFRKSIINKELGGGEDSFPYEYYCPDDFSVVVNPEDWTTNEENTYAIKQIPTQVTIPEGYALKMGTCNDTDYNILENTFVVYVEVIGDDLEVILDPHNNRIYITSFGEFDPSEVEPVTLNFKDLIFLGNKK